MANLEYLNKQMKDLGVEPKKEDTPTLKDAAMFGAEFIPGVGEALAIKRTYDALDQKDYVGAGIEATAGLLGVIPGVGDLAGKTLRTAFKKTRPAYKLLVQKPDSKLYPLFVQANKNLPKGEWLEAEFPETAFLGKTAKSDEARLYVPTKGAEREPKLYFLDDKQISKEQYDALGNNRKPDVKVIKGEKTKGTGTQIRVPDKATADKLKKEGFKVSKPTEKAPHGTVEAVAGRGGFHASQAPVATHLGPEDIVVSNEEVTKLLDAGMTPDAVKTKVFSYTPDGKPISKENIKKLSKEEQAKVVKKPVNYIKRRAEDQVFAVVDMADDVDYQSMLAKEGKTDLRDGVPKGGSYRYSDGQADSDQWVVGGDMKIQRVLSREEARAIQKDKNVTDLLYKDEIESILGRKFAKGGIVMDDYLVGKTMDEPQNFAEGGMPVAKQMEMFEDGGLLQEGGTVDPVSGNDVPPGSTQEEVRDDIPAQLSEGEFVFPADVVRYIGLGTLMKIRQDAKMGLKQMEAMGQMGNSDEATMPDDLPFDLNDLDMDDEDQYNGRQEFAVGGMPTPNPDTGVYYTPSAVQGTTGITTQQPMQATSSQYMAPQQQAVPTTAVPAIMPSYEDFIQPIEAAKPELREYINAETGEKKSITFINNQPTTPIPEGFVPASEYVKPETSATQSTSALTNTGMLDEGDGYQEPDNNAFGGFSNSLDSDAYSKMTAELGMYQLGSLSPKAALGSELAGKTTPKDVSTAMYQAKVAAIADLGIAKVDGNTIDYTNDDGTTKEASKEDLDFIAAVMNRAKTAVQKGMDAREAAKQALEQAKADKAAKDKALSDAAGKAREAKYADESNSEGDGSFSNADVGTQESSARADSYSGGRGSGKGGGSTYGDPDGRAKGGLIAKQMKRSGLASK